MEMIMVDWRKSSKVRRLDPTSSGGKRREERWLTLSSAGY